MRVTPATRIAAATAVAVLAALLIVVIGAAGAAAQPATPTVPVTPTPATPAPTTTPPTTTTAPSRWVTPPSTTSSPATPAPTTPGTTTPTPGSGSAECGVTNINGCVENAIDGFFRRIVESALNPLLELLSETLLTTPEPSEIPQIGVLWDQSWQIVTALYVLVVMAAGVLLMMRETFQTQWSIRELAPRLVVGFVAGGLSMAIATAAISFANALAGAVAGDDVDSTSAAAALTELATTSPQTQSFGLLLYLAFVLMLLVLLISYVVRVTITILLVVGAPLALMCHALPGIDGVARWWWRSFAACLGIQVVQSLILVTVLRVMLAPGGWYLFGPDANEIVNMIVALALMFVLIKTPFWLLSVLKIGQGRSFVGSIVRGFIAYKTLGLLKGTTSSSARTAASAASGPRTPRAARAPRAPRTAAGTSDPFARVRSTRDGQLMLPLEGVRRVPRQPGPTPAEATGTPPPRPARTPRGRQLAFDFTPPDPYRGTRAGAGGQYPLPIPVRRVRTTPPAPPPPERPGRRATPQQLAFDFTEPAPADPYARLRPNRSGQYPLPFPVARVKPVAPPPNPPPPAPARPAGRQLHLPMPDLPVRRRASRAPRGGTLR
ncbi:MULTISPECIES: conjugal transfer protein TrbL family protein [Nocardia]|uniref:conjugal transfer protein TrbL family protein n=1 Tax=Nocardia TaxID=1817 RepID=UPI001C4F66D4|nr:conjugal transfer protein TrbL family protein [Nocardia sp. MH4]